ncbi:MAG TPA: nuclear transport factor 2 family protein [Alphaproteobacteria bacterium]|nr:nuclear transport factor 2 family protein [Alphaproteobacteria bacterium]
MRYLHWLLIGAVLALCLIGCWKEPARYSFKNATGAEQYERLMWQAIQDKDWKQVQLHLAPAFVGVNQGGQALDRSGWSAYWKDHQPHSFTMAEVTVQPAGADMVVSYILHLDGDSGALRVVSVWQGVKSSWVLIAQSVTTIK